MNPYTNYSVPSYFAEMSPDEKAKLMPMFQNIGQQQANQQAALSEQNQQVMQAGQIGKKGGNDSMALAMMLRKKKPNDPYENAQAAMDKYGAENVYGYGGQGQTPTSWNGEA
jgi:hypothetical protein